MKVKPSLILATLLLMLDRTLSEYDSRFCGGGDMATMLGGVHEHRGETANSVEAEVLARFAVDEHNKNQNVVLDFVRVVEPKEQVVACTLHRLTIEAVEAGKKKKLYEAKVWVKPWLNFKELQEFKHAGDVPTFTSSDLEAKQGYSTDHRPRIWIEVPSHDPTIQDAENHALKTIQERSNSLFPYELQEVVRANAELVDESAKFDMLLKVKRGNAEEKFKVEMQRNLDGAFHLNRTEPYN